MKTTNKHNLAVKDLNEAILFLQELVKKQDWPAVHEQTKHISRIAFRIYLATDEGND